MPISLSSMKTCPDSENAGMHTTISYVMDNPNNLNFFNGIIKTNAELSVNPPLLDAFDTGVNPPDTVSKMIQMATGKFTCKLPSEDGRICCSFDQFSTRSFLFWSTPNIQTPRVSYLFLLLSFLFH